MCAVGRTRGPFGGSEGSHAMSGGGFKGQTCTVPCRQNEHKTILENILCDVRDVQMGGVHAEIEVYRPGMVLRGWGVKVSS